MLDINGSCFLNNVNPKHVMFYFIKITIWSMELGDSSTRISAKENKLNHYLKG